MQTSNQERNITVNATDLAISSKSDAIRILQVDDDSGFLSVSKAILMMNGCFEIDQAASVDEAFGKLSTGRYDVIISDYEMPLKNGLQFLKELREQKNEIPFILFTGKGREEVAIQALNLGAESYINKSGSPEAVYCELADAVCRAAEHNRSMQLLVESEIKYRTMVEKSLQGILICQVSPLRFVFANSLMGKILGYSVDELKSLSPEEVKGLIHDEDKAIFFDRLASRVRGEPAKLSLEFRAWRKDGSIVWLEAFSNRIEYMGQPAVQGVFLDITERKKGQEILKESEKRYRELANSLPEIVFETDSTGKFTFISQRALEVTGFTKDELEGRNLLRFVAPKQRERAMESIKKTLAGENIGSTEYTLMRKNGTTFPALVRTSLITLENRVMGVRGIIIDITERKEMEDKLTESEAKYRDIFDNARDAIYVHNLKGKMLSVNKVVEEYGLTQEQIVGKNFLKFIPKKYWPKLVFQLSQLAKGKRIEGDIEIITPLGRRSAEYKSNPIIRSNKVVAVHSVLRDMTERKKNEEALLESQQKFSALFAANPEAAAFVDNGFHIIEANSRFSKLFGYSLDEIRGKVITDIIVPEESKEEAGMIRQKILSSPVEIVTKRRRRDGSQVPLFMSGGPVLVDKMVIGCIMVYKDISEIITAQEELGKALSKAELLNEKLSIVGGFVRHDVRNKLSAINGNVYLMKKTMSDNPLMQQFLNQIKLSSDNIVCILDFAKTFELLGNEKLVPVDVGAAFDQAISLLTDLRGIKIINQCRGFSVMADSMLATIFHNLVDNSMKYGEKLTQIRLSDFKNGDGSCSIIYEDDGVGIDIETKKHLFEKGMGKGTGLGLYLIWKAVDVYGWRIDEVGLEGMGVRFVITVPKTSMKGQ